MLRTAGLLIARVALAATLAAGCSSGGEAPVESSTDALDRAGLVTPTAQAIKAARARLDRHLAEVSAIPGEENRRDAHPYYMIHKAGEPIHGTVLLFHGFSNKPHQMALLAKYLYDNDFNVYVPTLAGQDRNPPEAHWLRTQIKSELRPPVIARLGEHLVGRLSRIPDPLDPRGSSAPPAPDSEAASLQSAADTLKSEEEEGEGSFRFSEYFKAATTETEDDEAANALFAKYFRSNHMRYLVDAQERLEEVKGLGPISVVGLSVGGAVALGLAERNPQTIKRVVVHAPFLAAAGKLPRTAVSLLGPLDIMKMNWGTDFPLGAITAAGRFGGYVRTKENSKALRNVGTFMVLTASDKAADIATDEAFYSDIGGRAANTVHRFYKYPASANVPHPMTDPREKQSGTGAMNTRWKPLYRETLRFLLEGDIEPEAFARDQPAGGSVWELPSAPSASDASPETLDGEELPPRSIR